MPLWDGTTLNNTVLSHLFTKIHKSGYAIQHNRKRNGFFSVMLGKGFEDGTKAKFNFERLKWIGGEAIEIRHQAGNITNEYLTRGTGELALRSPAISNNVGNSKLGVALLYAEAPFTQSEIDEIQNAPEEVKKSKTGVLVQERYEQIQEGMARTLNMAMLGANAPGSTQIGGLKYMVSDGVSTGETAYANYLVDRSAAGNEWARSTVVSVGGTLTLGTITDGILAASQNRSSVELAVCTPLVWKKLKELAQQSQRVLDVNEDVLSLGARNFSYDGVTFLYDHDLTDNEIYLLDPSTFALYCRTENTVAEVMKDVTRKGAHVMQVYQYWQFLCDQPNKNVKIKDFTL
jgi:hypothetical protein